MYILVQHRARRQDQQHMPYRIAEPTADVTPLPPVVAEVTRLSYGHLCNPAVATVVSLIDPLPHQRIAVYERMLGPSPLP